MVAFGHTQRASHVATDKSAEPKVRGALAAALIHLATIYSSTSQVNPVLVQTITDNASTASPRPQSADDSHGPAQRSAGVASLTCFTVAQFLNPIVEVFKDFNTKFGQKLKPFEGADSKQVVESLTRFVVARQPALNTVISKHELRSKP